jgi:hypothetical protein
MGTSTGLSTVHGVADPGLHGSASKSKSKSGYGSKYKFRSFRDSK